MKPNFALTLSFEGLALLHRAYPGWHSVGDVAFDVPDLPDALAQLRDRGLALDPAGMTCKLVIPDDQIRYLDFDPDGATGEALEQAVRDQLSGATPYALEDLAYDWSFEAGQVHVAAVALETLDEAEEFAARYGFNPVCFVAMPARGRFVGEPWFGQAAQAEQHMQPGAVLERDSAAIRIIGTAPEPSFADAAEPEPQAEASPQAEQEPQDEQEPQAEPESETEAIQSDPALAPVPESAPDTAPETDNHEAPVLAAGKEPVAAFRSVRASRDDATAPVSRRLEGAARGLTTIAPASSAAPPVTGHPEDSARDHDAPDLRAASDDRLHPAENDNDPAAAFFTQRDAAVSSVTATPPPPADEKQRMTIFGARDAAPVGGKPRYLGLALTAALLLFLVAVAAWASIFMDDGVTGLFRSKPSPQIAVVPAPEKDTPDETTAAAPLPRPPIAPKPPRNPRAPIRPMPNSPRTNCSRATPRPASGNRPPRPQAPPA